MGQTFLSALRNGRQECLPHEVIFRRPLRRLINANSQVRKAPTLIEAAQSAKTYGEQMRALIDLRLELSIIGHEIETAKEAFPNASEIRNHVREMEDYLADLTNEYKKEYKVISNAQAQSPEQVWPRIQALERTKDLLNGDENSEYYKRYVENYFAARDKMRKAIWATVGVANK